jgi:hypothetical protein
VTVVEEIVRLLPAEGKAVLFCPPAVAAQVHEACATDVQLVVLTDASKLTKAYQRLGDLPVVQAELEKIPLAPRSVDCVVAVDVLSRTATPLETLAPLCKLLHDGGRLVVAERLMRSPTLRVLRRVTTPGSRRLLPEDVCGALLNADVGAIRQTWPQGYPERVVTHGRLKVI